MATIESFTAAHILELIDDTLAGAIINNVGNLIVTTKGGETRDLGPIMTTGELNQYYRGDKTWALLDKAAIGLSNVDNVSVLSDYVPKWKTGKAYIVGDQVVTPSGLVMTSTAVHTASAAFVTDIGKWKGLSTDIPYGYMGKTSGFQSLGGVNTVVTMDAAQELRGGITFDNVTDSLVIPTTGRYRARLKGYFSGSTSSFNNIRIFVNGVLADGAMRSGIYEKLSATSEKNTTSDVFFQSSGIVPFNAGDKVALCMNSAVSAWGTNGYNGSGIELEYVSGP